MGDGMLHVDRLGLLNRMHVPCSVCGKVFPKTEKHVYRVCYKGVEYFSCSWTCHRAKKAEIAVVEEAKNAGKKRKTPLKEQPSVDEDELKQEDMISQAKARIRLCKRKEKEWTERAIKARKGSPARKSAKNNARVWREKQEAAKEALAKLTAPFEKSALNAAEEAERT